MPVSKSFEERLHKSLPQIIEKFGTPFHIYDGPGIHDTLRDMKETFRLRNLSFKEFYAVKALPKPAIMEIIKDEQCGFDCSSIPELRLARNAGAKPEDIMFTANNVKKGEFREALDHGGCIMNLDGIEYIPKLEALCREITRPFPELICFRLNPGTRKTGDSVNSIIGNPVDAKYGVPIEDIVEAYRAIQKIAEQQTNQDRKKQRYGLHTMVCSNDRDYTHMVATYRLLLEVAAQLKKELGIELEFVNVGGGLGIPYRPGDTAFDLKAFADECYKLTMAFAQEHGYAPAIFMESGRYVTGPHGVLINRVINVFKKYKNYVGIEVAMPALMRVGMYPTSAYHHCILLNPDGSPIEEGSRPIIKVTIVGSICENCDVLARDVEMPEPREGDLIMTCDTGAHGSAMCFNYNGRERIQELLEGFYGNVRRICRAETYDDLDIRHQGLEGQEHRLKVSNN